MVFGFDPRKLIEEEKDNEKNKINEVLSEEEKFDKVVEEQNAKAKKWEEQEQKIGVVAEAFEEVKDILKEVNYAKKYGNKKYAEEKRKQDPDNPIFDSPDTSTAGLGLNHSGYGYCHCYYLCYCYRYIHVLLLFLSL